MEQWRIGLIVSLIFLTLSVSVCCRRSPLVTSGVAHRTVCIVHSPWNITIARNNGYSVPYTSFRKTFSTTDRHLRLHAVSQRWVKQRPGSFWILKEISQQGTNTEFSGEIKLCSVPLQICQLLVFRELFHREHTFFDLTFTMYIF